jgi:hypothetical protein
VRGQECIQVQLALEGFVQHPEGRADQKHWPLRISEHFFDHLVAAIPLRGC